MEVQRRRVVLEDPYDLDLTIDSWVFPDIQPTPEWKILGQFGRCLPIEGEQVPIRVIQLEKGSKSTLVIEWPTTWIGDGDKLVQHIGWLLGWDIEVSPVLSIIRNDPIIAHLAESLVGLRPFSQPTIFEALVKAMLQQQVNYRFACQITRNLVLAYGSLGKVSGRVMRGFPTAAELVGVAEADLRQWKLGYKASYLQELVTLIVKGGLDLDGMIQKDPVLVLQELDAIRGVGPWTAELTILTGCRNLNVFPYGDLGIRNLISRLFLGGEPAHREDVKDVAKRWRNNASLVLYFLMCAQVLGLV